MMTRSRAAATAAVAARPSEPIPERCPDSLSQEHREDSIPQSFEVTNMKQPKESNTDQLKSKIQKLEALLETKDR